MDRERETCKKAIAESDQRLMESRQLRDTMQNQRRDLFKQDAALEESLRYLKEQNIKFSSQSFCCTASLVTLFRWQKQLSKSMSRDTRQGLEMCMKVVKEHKIQGVYGTLGELLSCRDPYFTAVEVTARNNLFSVVVQNSVIAEEIIQHLVRGRLGRVTFIPLDKIHEEMGRETPDFGSSQAYPLVKFLKSEEALKPVLHHVFGKTVLVSDLDVAAEIVHKGFNCVTIEGDEVRRNGAMKGGHYDPSRSRMRAIKESNRVKEEYHTKEAERKKTAQALGDLDRSIAQCLTQIEQLNLAHQASSSKLQQASSFLWMLEKEKFWFAGPWRNAAALCAKREAPARIGRVTSYG